MKKLLLILSSLAITTTLAQAKNPGYSVNMSTNGIQIGESTINVSIRGRSGIVSNASLKLTVNSPDNSVKVYRVHRPININQYIFKVNTQQKGKYNYVLKYNRMGGIDRYEKGSWKI